MNLRNVCFLLVGDCQGTSRALIPAALPGLPHSVKAPGSLLPSRQQSSSSVNMAKAVKTTPCEAETPLHRAEGASRKGKRSAGCPFLVRIL